MNQVRAFRGISTLNVAEVSPKLKKEPLKTVSYKVPSVLEVPKLFEKQSSHDMHVHC